MAKKGQVFQQYTNEFKEVAVKEYLKGLASFKVVAENLGIRNCTQLKVWVRKWRDGEEFDVRKSLSNPLKGRTRTSFASVEEERDHLKVQVDYLKKRYPNLVKEASSVSKTTIK
ncbi:transposase [Paenibacillus crassostreae]|uniref:Transposase n=1 Tax=Paenibacillus crassostreae TaxID=1763538 RepID=A0A162KSP1_9BACL|nr:transposase [Paenibacillus crassostreae]AOZ91522.1 transposase [Paenibacillus crassostreae]AOZ91962.1 transposase [Paenibacillus crassostreae]AOZ91976.1 transposase [Paenibacillus crassostreae]AOZ92431.1 transposase [Paenibacillus crassostreae]OAB73293.1 transposase [Paenibacillus crassostreae]